MTTHEENEETSTDWEKYLQKTHLKKKLLLKYMNNS